jgi:hypothetical protein
MLLVILFQCVAAVLIKNQFTFYVSCIKEHFSHACHPPGLPISPNLLCLRTLEVLQYVCVYAASHLRQVAQTPNLAITKFRCECKYCLLLPVTVGEELHLVSGRRATFPMFRGMSTRCRQPGSSIYCFFTRLFKDVFTSFAVSKMSRP